MMIHSAITGPGSKSKLRLRRKTTSKSLSEAQKRWRKKRYRKAPIPSLKSKPYLLLRTTWSSTTLPSTSSRSRISRFSTLSSMKKISHSRINTKNSWTKFTRNTGAKLERAKSHAIPPTAGTSYSDRSRKLVRILPQSAKRG